MDTTFSPRSSPSEIQAVVLLVDDQAVIIEAVRRLLSAYPEIEFHACQDPRSAEAMAMEVLPTAILQDLEMEGLHGLSLLTQYRANSALRDVPVIVLSSNDDAKSKGEAFRLGANDYVVKLPSALELAARLKYHSQAYISNQQKQAVFRALQENQRALKARNLEVERQKALLEEQAKALEKANQELAESAFCDPMTGLYNRRYFKTFIEPELVQWEPCSYPPDQRRTLGDEIIFYLFDLDHFKQVNDNYGHDAGDAVLIEVAQRLKQTLRRDDTVMRWGGEEFLVVARRSLRFSAQHLALRILHALADKPIEIPSGLGLRVTASIGWAPFPWRRAEPQAITQESIQFLADTAVYLSKRGGRNRATGVMPEGGAWPEAVRKAGKSAPDVLAQEPSVRLISTLGPAPIA